MTDDGAPLAAPSPSTTSPVQRRRWWTLAVLGLVQLMVALDVTIINIALPRAQAALHFSTALRQWPLTGYALAFGALLLLGGRLGDWWGRRTALLIGLVGFAAASAVGGAATSFAMLVSARAVQGAFAAVLAPAALAALTTTFVAPAERARAFAIYGALAGSGAAIGLIVGGALTQWVSWRWTLYVNVVFGLVALVGVLALVPRGRPATHDPLDLPGLLLGGGGLFLVVYGFANAVTASWGDAVTMASLVLGVILLVAFVAWQRRSRHPLVPLRIVAHRTRGGSLAALFLSSAGLFGVSLFLTYYLENLDGYSPLRTGIAYLPMVGALAVTAAIASARLLGMVGPRPLVPAGMALTALGLILFTRLPLHAAYLSSVLPGLILTGLGLGLVFAPAIASATAGVRAVDAGAASASVNTFQQVGGSMGTALLNTIAVSAGTRAFLHGTGPVALRQAAATVHGDVIAFWWAAGLFVLGAVVSLALLRSGPLDLSADPAT